MPRLLSLPHKKQQQLLQWQPQQPLTVNKNQSPSIFAKQCQCLFRIQHLPKHKAKGAPLAMVAFANEAAEKTIQKKKMFGYFDGLSMEAPHCHDDEEEFNNPMHHSIIVPKLFYID